MTLDELKSELQKQIPIYRNELNSILLERSNIVLKDYPEKDISRAPDLKIIDEKERFLCGIIGAMNRLDDQLLRLKEVKNREQTAGLVKGMQNDQ